MKIYSEPRVHIRYSEAFRLKILDEIKCSKVSINDVSLLYGIGRASLYRWINKYGKDNLIAKKVRIELKGEVSMLKKKDKQIADLKDAVAQLTLENICLRAMTEVMDESLSPEEKKSLFSRLSPEQKRLLEKLK